MTKVSRDRSSFSTCDDVTDIGRITATVSATVSATVAAIVLHNVFVSVEVKKICSAATATKLYDTSPVKQ